MALVERMSIVGIRSFSPETSQKIEFFLPVTLILGPNGSGKTTIIECLKYSTTGDLPPGSKTGCSFVHDPRVAQETEVKAKVTLQIRDVRGQTMTVSRALVATQRDKAKQGTLRTLDGTIKRQSPDGRDVSISSKCTEIDSEMITSLGVSKAVLENVIFCHQEDSNWPLHEAKSVKQRFDDLFASSRYVKALDAIRKCKQENDGNVKIYRTELKHLEKGVAEARKVRCEHEEMQRTIDVQEKSLLRVTGRLDPISEQLHAYRQKYAELVELQAEIKTLETEKIHLEQSASNLLLNVKDEFKGTNEQLSALIEDAEVTFEQNRLNVSRLEDAIQLDRMKLREAEAQRNKFSIEVAQLELEVKHLTDASNARDKLLRSADVLQELPDHLPFLESGQRLTDDEAALVVHLLSKCVTTAATIEAELKSRFLDCEKKENEFVREKASELARVEQNFEDTQRSLHETEDELFTINQRLESAKFINVQLEVVRGELAEATANADRTNSSRSLLEARHHLATLTDVQLSTEQSLQALEEKICIFQQHATQLRELEALKKDRSSKFETLRRIRSRHLESLEQLCGQGSIPAVLSEAAIEERNFPGFSASDGPPRLRQTFLKRFSVLEQETRETRQRLAKSEKEKSVYETKVKFSRSQLQEIQDKAKKMEELILSVSGTNDFDQQLLRLQEKRKILEEECANGQGSLYLWRRFRDRIARSDPDCPVCHRDLSDLREQQELLAEIDERIQTMPDEFSRKKAELDVLVKQHDSLLELRPVNVDLQRLRSIELPTLQARLNDEMESLRKATLCSEEESVRLEMLQADEALARSVQGDLAILERVENELLDSTATLKRLQSELNAIPEAESLKIDSIQEERKNLRTKQLSITSDINKCRELIDRLDKDNREAVDKVHHTRDRLHKLEQENQANIHLGEEIVRLSDLIGRLRCKLSTLESDDLPNARQARDTAVRTLRQESAIREKELEQQTQKTNRLRDLKKQVDLVCLGASVGSLVTSENSLSHVQQRLTVAEQNISSLQASIDRSSSELELARKQLNEHKLHQRELADCAQLRHLRSQSNQLCVRISQLNSRLATLNSSAGNDQDLVQKTISLSREEEKLLLEKQTVVNLLGQMKAKLQYLERDMNEKYSDADKSYLDMVYQLKTTQLACSDLERYYNALDRAIMAYHASKMADLNKIIRNLWQSTYSGNDIDYIEICSEEDTTASVSNAARARRTYNYRVVMVKTTSGMGGTACKSTRANTDKARLDMRGRCSSGQKVLASLIIRLALAEVFCLHCGVLALDEPTTNLDRENIESLAYALVEIIKNRKHQRNFQLIVITHDEDFVCLLGRSDYVDKFYMVSRDIKGLSEIREVPIEEHFH